MVIKYSTFIIALSFLLATESDSIVKQDDESYFKSTIHTIDDYLKTYQVEKKHGLQIVKSENSAIYIMLENGWNDLVIDAVDNGFDVFLLLPENISLLEQIIFSNNVYILNYLVDNNIIDINDIVDDVPIIFKSIGNSNFENLSFNYLISLNPKLSFRFMDTQENIAYYAANIGNYKALSTLLNLGVEYKYDQSNGLNLLETASINFTNIETIQTILDFGVVSCKYVSALNMTLVEFLKMKKSNQKLIELLSNSCKNQIN